MKLSFTRGNTALAAAVRLSYFITNEWIASAWLWQWTTHNINVKLENRLNKRCSKYKVTFQKFTIKRKYMFFLIHRHIQSNQLFCREQHWSYSSTNLCADLINNYKNVWSETSFPAFCAWALTARHAQASRHEWIQNFIIE